MKKILLASVLALPLLTCFNAFSEETMVEQMEPPIEYVMSLLMQCKGEAIEDEIAEQEMDKYLLTCINEELEISDYKPITVLPKDE